MNPAARWALGRIAFDVHERSPALSLTLGVPREWSDIDLDEQEAWCQIADAVLAAAGTRTMTPKPFRAADVADILKEGKK